MKRRGLFLLMALALGGCSHPAFREGLAALSLGKKEEGISSLEKAVRDEPRNAEMKASLIRHRGETIDGYLAEAERQRAAGQPEAAGQAYRQVLALDAGNARARQGMEQLVADRRNGEQLLQAEQLLKKSDLIGAERVIRTVRAQDPLNTGARQLQQQVDQQREKEGNGFSNPAVKAALAKPVVLEFRDATLKSVFEVLSRSSGLNFVFDKDVKGDSKVTLFVRNSPLEDILRLILKTNQLEKSQLNDNSFLIYPNSPAKGKEYQELVVRSFYLANTDVKQAMSLVKTVAKSKDVFADEKLNLLIVKDTPEAIRLIERLIESLDLAEPEVMLEVEVLEVTRSRLNEFGLDWPDSIGYGALQKEISTQTIANGVTLNNVTPGGTLAAGFVNAQKIGSLTSFVANPAFTLNIKGQNADTNVLANPRIRVKNREKAKIHIGDKLPVFTTTSTANVGVSASVNYLDVGLKLDVEPNVMLDDEVSIKIGLEVSSIAKEIAGPSNSLAYQIGTRSASTVLRLKNGETSVLAGLISDEERKSTSHVPGIGEIPILGRAFGSHRDTSSKTEIILLITPRVLRNIHRPDFGQPALPSGTESTIGALPLAIKTQGPKSLGISPRGGSAAVQPPLGTPGAIVEVDATAQAPASAVAEGLQISGPAEATGGSEIDIGIATPGQGAPVIVDIAFDPTLLEAKLPAASGAGRVSLRVDQGRGSLRLRALPGAKGETRVDVVGAALEGGEAIAGAAGSHVLKLKSP
ncbi:secretin and TonB N-terminal domain-containing protein [Dechloromonas denitrificans]|uniref:secretin and TonB N-terminal domain-containing protein n=1 Tax=Dechloromonas denitrificans TaxID=281362 RepID=UPI001CF82E1A|nr:secretin and TonB N-terminal domain-containing protein [Dechloromonas denitrificans]